MEQSGFPPDQPQYYQGAKGGWQQFFAALVDRITSNYTISLNGSFVDTKASHSQFQVPISDVIESKMAELRGIHNARPVWLTSFFARFRNQRPAHLLDCRSSTP